MDIKYFSMGFLCLELLLWLYYIPQLLECQYFFTSIVGLCEFLQKRRCNMYKTNETVERIRDFAKRSNIKLTDMLKECDLNKNALSSMQSRGSWLQANNLAKIADYLGCSVDYLLGRTDNPKAHESNVTPAIVEINTDKQQLCEMFDLLTEREKGEIMGELKVMTRDRVSDKNTKNAASA